MNTKPRKHYLRNLIAIFAIISGFVFSAAWIINRPETLRHALAIANLESKWKVQISKIKWKPLESTLDVEGVSLIDEKKNKNVSVRQIHLSYRLLGLLRGKMVVDKLLIDDVNASLPPSPEPNQQKKEKRLNLAKLILLKNLELKECEVHGFNVSFGESFLFATDELRISLIPGFFGNTGLTIRTDGLVLSKKNSEVVSAGVLQLGASTDLARWYAEFPYLNSLDGNIKLRDIRFEELSADSLGAKLKLLDKALSLKNFELIINGKMLEGNLDVDGSKESFNLAVNIPKPIQLPYIGRPMDTLSTAGALSGSIAFKGEGFDPLKLNGSGKIDITHTFDVSPDASANITANVIWSNGSIKIAKGDLSVGKDPASIDANINIKNKNFKLSAQGEKFSLEHVFDKFSNPHLAKIFGPTDFDGSIEGWGKKFIAKVKGVTHNGGWKPITADRVESELEATYDSLSLKGNIFSGSRQTGKADLLIKYGKRIDEKTRAKQIELDASITNHPLAASLSAYALGGTGTAHIHLAGAPTTFTSEVTAQAENGTWHGVPFDYVSTKLAITRRKLIFSDMVVKIPKTPEPKIIGELVGDIGDDKLRLHGTPIEGLNLDFTNHYASGQWTISDVSWNDANHPGSQLKLSGNLLAKGLADLKLKGRVDLSSVASMAPYLVRSGSGPVDIDLSLRGSSSDLKIYGTTSLNENVFSPRGASIALENVNGALKFDGSKIILENITAKVDEGDIKLSGSFSHRNMIPTTMDISLDASSMRWRTEDNSLRLEFDGEIEALGPISTPLIKGSMTILDGKYTKDFTIIDVLFGSSKQAKNKTTKTAIPNFDPKFDLSIHNTGDMAIRNNVGDIWLNANVDLKGTRKAPIVSGSIDTTDGKIHYLGLEFDITKGSLEFRKQYAVPYLEVHAQKEINVYDVSLTLYGPTDNLALDLSATSPAGPLEKRDVVSLILFGTTEQERTLATAGRSGNQLTNSLVSQTVSGLIERPLLKATHLDVFRLEAAESTSSNISRIYLGKQISDRVTVNFATDINTSHAIQTVIGEYLITDNLLVSGARSSDSNYKISGTLRFRLR